MIVRKLSLVLLLMVSLQAVAAEKDEVAARFVAYWGAYVSANYGAAATFVHPEDLSALRSDLLPVFVDGLSSTHPELKQLAEVFFYGVPEAQRTHLSGQDTLVQLMRFIERASPDAIEFARRSRMTVGGVEFDSAGAVVSYEIVIEDVSAADSERLTKLDDVWFIRSKQNPRELAAKFRAVFQR